MAKEVSPGVLALRKVVDDVSINVRRGEGPGYATKFSVRYGAEVTVLKHGKTWDYIRYNGKEGYIMNKFLQTSVPTDVPDPSAVPDPSVTPTPKPEFQPYDTTVNTDKVNFHKQAGSWSSNVDFVGLDGKGQIMAGETVTVLGFKGEWAHVEYAGRKGWILKKFLN